ncbi:MAG: hypothetical protein EBT08_21055 [Betaproteobacteria bacterium]|nr:hypothetical protein [Betaproteobacteria bacterium]
MRRLRSKAVSAQLSSPGPPFAGPAHDLIPKGLSAAPDLQTDQLMVLLSGLLGFGGMRIGQARLQAAGRRTGSR